MKQSILNLVKRVGLVKEARAHCDIPCGIYDTGPALIAAVSVVRLMDIMHEASSENAVALANMYARNVAKKEEEAEKVKHEIRIIWGDYFKPALQEKHPEVHALVHSIMMKASACKQDVHREDAVALVELVNQFAELFWTTKGVETYRAPCPYPPKLDVVYPDLKG
ncbi:MAG: superoxide dismutase, Ni [Pseudomonadota bacterium]